MNRKQDSNSDLKEKAQTALALMTYIAELKESANALAEQISTNEQGVFRPDQEASVLDLLVGYWQSRNALLELVYEIKDDGRTYGKHGDRLFLVGFAGALALLDAAMFLMEFCRDRPVVKSKLNEPNEELGIPAGVYNRVQASLHGVKNAWHLHHAVSYFHKNEGRILENCQESALFQSLHEIVEQLRHRIDMPDASFQKSRLKNKLVFYAGFLRRNLVGKAIYSLQKVGGIALAEKYIKPKHTPSLPDQIRSELLDILEPGDVILCRKEFAVTNYFLPGYWPHAALFLGTADEVSEISDSQAAQIESLWEELAPNGDSSIDRVLEAKADGVRVRSTDSPFDSDSVLILRPKLLPDQIGAALLNGLSHIGKVYDFGFDLARADRLVCTEVVYRSYDGQGDISFPLVKRAGHMTLSGNDLVLLALQGEFFDIAAVYAPLQDQQVLTGPSALPLVKKCMKVEDAVS